MPSCPPLLSPFNNKRDESQEGEMGTRVRRDGGATLRFCLGVVHLSAFLVWMKTSAGRCSWGTTGSAKLERLISAQTGKILLICILKFPGILNKCFFKPGNLAEESSPITQTTKKTGQIV